VVEPNDFWTHVGLVSGAFVFVVAPRLFSPGHTVNSIIYVCGGVTVVAVAVVARVRAGMRRPRAARQGGGHG
jgi:hypothetical protein